jgi:hypothetical protein
MRKPLYKNAKATVCAEGNCVTVFGPAAELITLVTVIAALFVATAFVVKAIK